MVATGSTNLPSAAAILLSVVTGSITAARGIQKMLTPPPPPSANTDVALAPITPGVARFAGHGVELLRRIGGAG
jgi:hypothetical protein